MSWLKIDDGFEDHPKVVGLSDGAHRLWMRAACWCRKPHNSRSAPGFVPSSMLHDICRGRVKKSVLVKLTTELVTATGGGMFEFGLWEVVDGGWQFHDWSSYQPENSQQESMSRSESARKAGQRSAAVRLERFGTAQPNRSNDVPNDVPPNNTRTTFDRTIDRTILERPEPPLPSPSPFPEREREERESRTKNPEALLGSRRFVDSECPDEIEPLEKTTELIRSRGMPPVDELLDAFISARRKVGARCGNWPEDFHGYVRKWNMTDIRNGKKPIKQLAEGERPSMTAEEAGIPL
jgi:hypothetical protein